MLASLVCGRGSIWSDVKILWPAFLSYCKEHLALDVNTELKVKTGGRKTNAETKKQAILDEFEKLSVQGKRGELIAFARKLKEIFPAYEVDSIRKMIQTRYNEKREALRKEG